MIHADRHIRRALAAFTIPEPLTLDSLFASIQKVYPRPLELLRGEPPIQGLRANGLWITRPDRDGDAMWVAPELTGAAAVHSLAHELGHFLLGHKPVPLPSAPAEPEPEAYEYLSANFLGGSLLGRARSQEAPLDPEYVQIEDQAEEFAFRLRRVAAQQARETRHRGDPLVERMHHSL
ncbi:hypothetical protein [Streptomyces sp. NPDC127108]|uniref:hypothetical protein n=1 Tax=Streptomyces sp. NPDC127108 TaxID=3345361 RepID=UPI00362696B7